MKTTIKTLMLACFMLAGFSVLATEETSKTNKDQLVADWERAKEFTLEYIDAMTEEGFFKSPTEGIRTFAQQMLHLADGCAGIVAIGTGKPGPFEGRVEQDASLDTKAKVRATVVAAYDYVIATVKAMDMSTSDEKAQAFGQDLSRIVWIQKAFEHQTHHRGQTTIYLRMLGIAPPAEKLF